MPPVNPPRQRTRLQKGGAVALIVVPLVGAFEGLKTVAYRDPVGIPTVCFGETKGVRLGQHYTTDQCKDMLLVSLQEHEQGMRACLKDPDGVPAKVYGAEVSITYNIGTGAFCKSSIARFTNAGDYKSACDAFLLYEKARGIRLPGLVRRRQEERTLCLQGA